jgi:hypothetical protein
MHGNIGPYLFTYAHMTLEKKMRVENVAGPVYIVHLKGPQKNRDNHTPGELFSAVLRFAAKDLKAIAGQEKSWLTSHSVSNSVDHSENKIEARTRLMMLYTNHYQDYDPERFCPQNLAQVLTEIEQNEKVCAIYIELEPGSKDSDKTVLDCVKTIGFYDTHSPNREKYRTNPEYKAALVKKKYFENINLTTLTPINNPLDLQAQINDLIKYSSSAHVNAMMNNDLECLRYSEIVDDFRTKDMVKEFSGDELRCSLVKGKEEVSEDSEDSVFNEPNDIAVRTTEDKGADTTAGNLLLDTKHDLQEWASELGVDNEAGLFQHFAGEAAKNLAINFTMPILIGDDALPSSMAKSEAADVKDIFQFDSSDDEASCPIDYRLVDAKLELRVLTCEILKINKHESKVDDKYNLLRNLASEIGMVIFDDEAELKKAARNFFYIALQRNNIGFTNTTASGDLIKSLFSNDKLSNLKKILFEKDAHQPIQYREIRTFVCGSNDEKLFSSSNSKKLYTFWQLPRASRILDDKEIERCIAEIKQVPLKNN